MKPQRVLIGDLAGIEYVGRHGITASCIRAITCLLSGGERFEKARLVTCGQDHAFVLRAEHERDVAVKAGFTSGYAGEGPSGLATVLAILAMHNVDIEEYEVERSFMDRLSWSSLLQDDVDFLEKSHPVRPQRWHEYIYDVEERLSVKADLLSCHYPMSIPLALVDPRIHDLAVGFMVNPDAALLTAYRRLEGTVKKRTGLSGEGQKLFSAAFQVEGAPLMWEVADKSEAIGRAQLFAGVYMGFRNARAHREIEADLRAELSEFLLVNELFRLEAQSLTQEEMDAKRIDDDEQRKLSELLGQE